MIKIISKFKSYEKSYHVERNTHQMKSFSLNLYFKQVFPLIAREVNKKYQKIEN